MTFVRMIRGMLEFKLNIPSEMCVNRVLVNLYADDDSEQQSGINSTSVHSTFSIYV